MLGLLANKIADLRCSIILESRAKLTSSWKTRILLWMRGVSGATKSCHYSTVTRRDSSTRILPVAIFKTLKSSPDEDEVSCVSRKKLKIAYFRRHLCFAASAHYEQLMSNWQRGNWSRAFSSPEPPFLLVTWSAKRHSTRQHSKRVALGTRMGRGFFDELPGKTSRKTLEQLWNSRPLERREH